MQVDQAENSPAQEGIFSPPPTHPNALHEAARSNSTASSLNIPSPSTTESAPLLTIQLSCKVQAVHRLWSSHLTEAINMERYGAATSIHGHEYTFYVTFKGALCNKTGQIIALDLLEEILPLSISEHLSNKNLDTDLSYFLSRPSTLENVCLFAWRNINVITRPHPIRVVKVEVETEPCKRNEYSAKVDRVRVSYEGEKTTIPSL
ncbi:hypothetical protein JCM16303_002841 [Sporobolomyces ruberrimus]